MILVVAIIIILKRVDNNRMEKEQEEIQVLLQKPLLIVYNSQVLIQTVITK
jgi:hypothetical protein